MSFSDTKEDGFSPKRFGLLLAFALAVMYFRVLFADDTFYYRDFGVLAVPTAMYHKTSLLAGEMPFWNPFSNCGAPFLAQWGTMVLYPLSLIYVLLPMPWSLNFFCIVHLWLGGIGMFFLARRWRAPGWPAAIAGIAFVFNGITQAALAWPNYIAALAWFPWVLLLTERLWTQQKDYKLPRPATSGRVIAAAVASTMQLLAGVPELSVLTWVLVTAFFAARLIKERAAFKPMIVRFVAVIAITAGLISIQLLPFYELLANSHRAPGFAAEKWALPIWGWANLILPRFRTFVTPQGPAFQYDQAFLTSVYLGIPLLFLASCSFARRHSRLWILAGTALMALILALGSRGILYALATKLLPALSMARYPVKFLFLLAFTIPLLAAFGASALSQITARSRKAVLLCCGVGALALVGGLIMANQLAPLQLDRLDEFRQNSMVRLGFALAMLVTIHFASGNADPKQRMAQFAFLLLFVLDAKTHLNCLNPVISSSAFKGEMWAVAHKLPKPTLGDGRVFITAAAEARLLESRVADAAEDLTGKRMAEWSHLNLLDRVPKVNGSSTLQVREQALLQKALYSGTNQHLEAWLDFLNVRYRTASNSVVDWQPRSAPAAFVTAGQAAIFDRFNPLEHAMDFATQATIHSFVGDSPKTVRAEVSITNLVVTSSELVFEAISSADSLAVIAQSWFPAWKAEVIAGRQVVVNPVLRANLAFQAVLLPPGRSRVRVYYDDHSFKLGAAISAATLLLCLLVWLREKKNTLLTNEKSVS